MGEEGRGGGGGGRWRRSDRASRSSDVGVVSSGDGGPSLNITPCQQVLASCSGAFITSLFVTPLDVVKVRLQAQQRLPGGAGPGIMRSLYRCFCTYCIQAPMERSLHTVQPGCAYNNQLQPGCAHYNQHVQPTCCTHYNHHLTAQRLTAQRFNGTMDAMLKISRFEGVRYLWSGFSAALLMTVPATVIYFTVYDRLKYSMGYRETDPSTLYLAGLAGAAARVGAATAISPLELVRTKMQSQNYSFNEVLRAVRGSIDDGGWRVLMRGLPPTLLRDVPFSAIYWLGYESLKSSMLQRNPDLHISESLVAGAASSTVCHRQLHITETLIAGAAAGTLAAVLTLPFDVVKTHQQVALGEDGPSKQRISSLRMMRDLYASRGITSLYAGFVPRIVKVAPACAIMISSYEYFKSYFTKYNQGS